MWFSVVYSLIDNDTHHHCGQNVGDSRGTAEWVHNKFVLDEKSLHYEELLSEFNSGDLYSIRCQDMMKTVFKTIQFETMWKDTRGLFQMRNTERNLRGSWNFLSHMSVQPLMVYTPSDILLLTCGTN